MDFQDTYLRQPPDNVLLTETMSEDCFALARKMRGKVPEFDDTYIETWIPENLLSHITQIGGGHSVDDEGFWWGANYVFATKIKKTSDIVVVVATKPLGMGCHELKAVNKHGNIHVLKSHEVL